MVKKQGNNQGEKKYKIGGLSFNGEEDVKPSPALGKLKADLNFVFDTPLESLNIEGAFQTQPIKVKKKESTKIKEVDLSKKRKKKKGNELI